MSTGPQKSSIRFGKFEVLQLLGRGGMAEVYKARIVEGPLAGQLVALKRLSSKLCEDAEALDLFTGEADISRLLHHPNIVQVFETGVVGDLYYLAMEYVEGRDLAHVLARCRELNILVPVPFAVHIARAMLSALAYAHAAVGPNGNPLNIVHCDVSPSNLFISLTGEIKLGDFGIAKVRAHGDGDLGGTLWGKLAYLAPELLDRAPLTPHADLWSAAAVLYECLASRRALQAANTELLKEAVRTVDVPPISSQRDDLPFGLDTVVHKALAKRQRDRYATAADFYEALAPFHDEAIGGALGVSSMVRGLFGVTNHG